jgi:hypothetical protein
MSDEATRYPLAWPAGWPRHSGARKHAAFSKRIWTGGAPGSATQYRRKEWLTVGDGISRLLDELRRLGARDIVISANLHRNLDGSIRASQAKMLADPGIAVYFKLNRHDRVLACDRWYSAADNMAAIAGHIAAMRAQDRYGVGTLDQAFAGYSALPPRGATWRTTLGFTPDQVVTSAEVDAAFRARSKGAHPDQQGGSHDAMASLTAARAEAREELGA